MPSHGYNNFSYTSLKTCHEDGYLSPVRDKEAKTEYSCIQDYIVAQHATQLLIACFCVCMYTHYTTNTNSHSITNQSLCLQGLLAAAFTTVAEQIQ